MTTFDKEFYTIPEAADLLRVHVNTMYNLVKNKQIEHYKIGRQIRISADELERLKIPAEKPV